MRPEYEIRSLVGSDIPFRGMASAIPASHLPPGLLASTENLRVKGGAAVVRLPLKTTGGNLEGEFRGAYECLFDGFPTLFVAVLVSGSVRVYKSTSGGASFNEITASSGPYGSTRLTDNGLVEFQVVRDRPPFSYMTAYDCLIFQNNTDTPRCYAHSAELGSGFAAYGVSKIVQPDTPANVGFSAGLENYFQISDPAAMTESSGVGFTLTETSATNGRNYISFVIDSTYVGATSTITFATPIAWPSQSFTWVVNSSPTGGSVTAIDWTQMKIEVGDTAGNYDTLYDPSNTDNALYVTLDTPPNSVDAFYQGGAKLTLVNVVSSNAIQYLRFTWMGAVPTAGNTTAGGLQVFGAQGFVQAGASLACAFMGADFRSIGPASVGKDTAVCRSGTVGGKSQTQVTLSDDPRFSYDYYLRSDNTTLHASGVNRMLVYRMSPGESDWYLIGTTLMAAYASSWALSSALGCFFEDKTGAREDFSRPALDSAYGVVPTGRAMGGTASRLFVGAGSRLWYSGAERPFQFRQYIRDDGEGGLVADSPGSLGIDGEQVQALLATGSLSGGDEGTGTAPNGVSTVFILTDRTVSWVTGWDATSLNKRNRLYDRGTYAPKSLAPSRSGFFFLDTDRQVVQVAGYQVRPVSRDLVDDRLSAIPDSRVGWCWGCSRNDRYYLCYTPSGGTSNTRCLIWDQHVKAWLSDTFPSAVAGASCLLPYRDGSTTRLFGMDLNGLAFEHEKSGQTVDQGSSGVAWSMTFPEVHAGLWQPVRVRRMGVVVDSGMGELTTSRTTVGREVASTATASIETDGGPGSRVCRWDSGAGVYSSSVSVSIAGASPATKSIHRVVCEVGPSEVGGPD